VETGRNDNLGVKMTTYDNLEIKVVIGLTCTYDNHDGFLAFLEDCRYFFRKKKLGGEKKISSNSVLRSKSTQGCHGTSKMALDQVFCNDNLGMPRLS